MPSAPIVPMPMAMPIHMGMGSMPMSFGSSSNNNNNNIIIPPREALPLPLTIEEFEQEQALQRELKKAYGDNYFRASGMAYRGVGGYRGGYRGPPSQWRPGGGRGNHYSPHIHTYIRVDAVYVLYFVSLYVCINKTLSLCMYECKNVSKSVCLYA